MLEARLLLHPRCFKDGHDMNLTPHDFVEGLKKKGMRVPGIGHR